MAEIDDYPSDSTPVLDFIATLKLERLDSDWLIKFHFPSIGRRDMEYLRKWFKMDRYGVLQSSRQRPAGTRVRPNGSRGYVAARGRGR